MIPDMLCARWNKHIVCLNLYEHWTQHGFYFFQDGHHEKPQIFLNKATLGLDLHHSTQSAFGTFKSLWQTSKVEMLTIFSIPFGT